MKYYTKVGILLNEPFINNKQRGRNGYAISY